MRVSPVCPALNNPSIRGEEGGKRHLSLVPFQAELKLLKGLLKLSQVRTFVLI